MCLEDIKIGRDTVDQTVSTKQITNTSGFPDVLPLVIPASQYRIGLRVWAWVFLLGDNPELLTNRSNGWTEVWVDSPNGTNSPFTQSEPFSYVHCLLTESEHTQLFTIDKEGLLVQRRIVLRPANLDSFTPTDVNVYMGFTEYTFPGYSDYVKQRGTWHNKATY